MRKKIKFCYIDNTETCFANTLDDIDTELLDDYKLHIYYITECPVFFKNPWCRNTKITVGVGCTSKLNKNILGKIIYCSKVNLYSTDYRNLNPNQIFDRKLGQVSGEHLYNMYANKEKYGDLFADITEEDLVNCHLFVKNIGNESWDSAFSIGHIKLKTIEIAKEEELKDEQVQKRLRKEKDRCACETV